MSSKVLAGGAVVWRIHNRTLQVLLIHRPRYQDWSWPKGKLDKGETLPACAVREVREETGYEIALGVPLPTVYYPVNGNRKECHYWAGTVISDTHPAVLARPTAKDASKNEVDRSEWFPAKAARKKLTRKADRAPLDHLMDLYSDGKLATHPVIVVRHGRAKTRSAHGQDEESRPLTKQGQRQADHLVPLLGAYGIDEVITSPWKRCYDTVAPYAQAGGMDLMLAPDLTEHAAKAHPKTARQIVAGMITEPRQAAALCTHRPVLPMVLEAIERLATRTVSSALPEEDPYLKVGEILVTHVATPNNRATRVIAVERHRPATLDS